jgi:hypothetical protein
MEEEKDHGEMATTIIGIELNRSLVIKRLIKSWPFLGLVVEVACSMFQSITYRSFKS